MLLTNLFLFIFIIHSTFSKEEDVVELSDNDFDTKLAGYETALVMFYAPWCGHCKRMKPEFAKAAEDLTANDPPIILAKVDCTEAGKETCNKNSVGGYPTLKIFRNGEFSQDYNGPRDASGIIKYMKAQVGPSSKELNTVADFEKYLKSENDVSVVGFFEKESDLKAAYFKIADKLRESIRFAHSTNKDVLEKQGLKNNIVLFRPAILNNKFEENSVTYDGSAESSSIGEFITKNYHGLCGHRKNDNKREFNNPLIVAYFGVDYVKNPKGTNYWRNRVLKVAKQFKDQINFAISSKDEMSQELNEYGVDFIKDDKPRVFARDEKNQKYVMEEPFSVEGLEVFAQDLLDGKLTPYLKSEAIPEANNEPVTVAVAKNFDDVVINNNKDTLVEFYAPWCGHCKKLTPIYDELATKLKDEDVAIVKMDATANDVPPPFDVRGFPTLYWLNKDSKDKPVRYDGGRELDDFIKYIAKHSTDELKSYNRAGKPKSDKTEL